MFQKDVTFPVMNSFLNLIHSITLFEMLMELLIFVIAKTF